MNPPERAGRAEERGCLLCASSNALYRPPRQVVPIIGVRLLPLMDLRGALCWGREPTPRESHFRLRTTGPPLFCWSSRLGLYTPFIRSRGV